MHPQLIHAMVRQPQFPELLRRLPEPARQLRIEGLPGSAPALLAAALAESLPQRMWISVKRYVTASSVKICTTDLVSCPFICRPCAIAATT